MAVKKPGDREKAYVCAGIRTKREGGRESAKTKTKTDCAKSDHAWQASPENNVYLCEEQASQASEECRSALLNRTEWSVYDGSLTGV
jgi:hypothetical protein